MQSGLLTKALVVGTLVILFFLSGFMRSDAATAAWGLCLLLLAATPSVAWLSKRRGHLPLFEVFAAAHLLYYWLPAGDRAGAFLSSPAGFRETFLMIICLFLFSGGAVYFSMLRFMRRRGAWAPALLSARVVSDTSAGWMMPAMWVSAAYCATLQLGLLMRVVPYSAFPVVRAVFMSLGGLTIFFLAVQLGRGRFELASRLSFFAALGVCVLSNVLSGFLVHAVGLLVIAFLAYALGARRIPFVTLGVGLLVFSFLNLGKAEWRAKYWHGGASAEVLTMANDWFQSSSRALEARLTRSGSSVEMTILERLDITAILSEIVEQTPGTLPFLEGETYIKGLELFVPRFMKPDRMAHHDIMTDFGLRYGFYYSVEQALGGTNISVGPIAEAWANGGWLAVALVGAFMGLFFGIGTSLAWGREPEEVGFLLAVPFAVLLSTGAMEFMLGATLMAFEQYFGVTLAILGLAAVMRRRAGVPVRRQQPLSSAMSGEIRATTSAGRSP